MTKEESNVRKTEHSYLNRLVPSEHIYNKPDRPAINGSLNNKAT